MRTIRFEFSQPPPSLNSSKVPVKGIGFVNSKKYADWRRFARSELSRQAGRIAPVCYWSSEILIPASKTKADLDNLPKGIHDLLAKEGRVPDDRFLVSLRVRFWAGDKVVVAVTQEETSKWVQIKKPSKSTLRQLAPTLK